MSKRLTNYRLVLLAMILIFTTTTGFDTYKQGNIPLGEPIQTGSNFDNIYWFPDGQQVGFRRISFDDWFIYNLQTQQLSQFSVWPLVSSLTDHEQALLGIVNGTEPFVYASYDQQYIVFTGSILPNAGYSVLVSNRLTGQIITLPITVLDPYYGPDKFRVHWSSDGKTFLLISSSLGVMPVVYRVTGYASSLPDVRIDHANSITINDFDFIPYNIYDFSGDGTALFGMAVNDTLSSPTNFLYSLGLYNIVTPHQSRILQEIDAESIIGGSFLSKDKILFVDDRGLIQYDLKLNLETIIKSFDGSLFEHAVFSPSSKYVLLVDNISDYDGNIYLIQTMDNFPPVADAGAGQTITDTDNNGSEVVTLDGSGSSDSDGTIVSYSWSEGTTNLGTGVTLPVTLAVGTHTLTLTVTDDDGATDTDEVVVTVSAAALTWR